MRKILAHDMKMKKNPQIKENYGTLSGFLQTFMGLCQSKVKLASTLPPRKFHQLASLTPKSSICCYFFQIFCIDWFKKKNAYFDKKSITGAVTDMIYFARSKFSLSLVHKKNFSLIWQVVFRLGYVFCQGR